MPKSRLISLPLAAALSVAALAGPAAASNLPGPPTWPANPQPITSYASQLPGPPTWPTNPQPITTYHSTVQATNTGLDWDSAGIGAAASAAILAAGAAGLARMQRRRSARLQGLTSH
jgi:hypothetical protein